MLQQKVYAGFINQFVIGREMLLIYAKRKIIIIIIIIIYRLYAIYLQLCTCSWKKPMFFGCVMF